MKNLISIEDVEVLNGTVTVDYLFNDNLLVAKLCYEGLKEYALNHSLNDYVFDTMHGEHIQDAGSLDIDTFVAENLKEVVLAYLLEYPLESVSLAVDAVVLRLNSETLLTA